MDEQTRSKVAQLVAGILATDGELHPAEVAFMRRVCEQLEVYADAKWELGVPPMPIPETAAETMGQLDEKVQKEALGLLIQAATVDGKVLPVEQSFLVAVAKAVGMSTSQLDDALTDSLLDDHDEG